METAANITQSSSQQEIERATKVRAHGLKRSARAISPIPTENEYTSDNGDNTFQEIDYPMKAFDIACRKKKLEDRETRMKHMQSQFASQPELEKICKDWNNHFVDSNLTKYLFTYYTSDCCEANPDDLKYIINLKGNSLTSLRIIKPCSSSMMPLIKSNCSNLQVLELTIDEIEDKDFENCFSNMPQLQVLMIRLKCENSYQIPMTLVKSIEQVSEALKTFLFSVEPEQNQLSSPASSVSVLSPSTEAFMTVIVNMKNIEKLTVNSDHGVTDEFLINLVKNAKKIRYLFLTGSNITDAGVKALNDAKELEYLYFNVCTEELENEFITDQSLECLFNEKLSYLNLPNCINVTDKGVIALVKNLPNIRSLFVENSNVTDDICEEIGELQECGETNLLIFEY